MSVTMTLPIGEVEGESYISIKCEHACIQCNQDECPKRFYLDTTLGHAYFALVGAMCPDCRVKHNAGTRRSSSSLSTKKWGKNYNDSSL